MNKWRCTKKGAVVTKTQIDDEIDGKRKEKGYM